MSFVSRSCPGFGNLPYKEPRILLLTSVFLMDKYSFRRSHSRGPMTPDERERMHILCERIAKEQDSDKFVKLVQELNDLLEHKEQRLKDSSKNA